MFMENTIEGKYRSLTEHELTVLSANGCTAEDWSNVRVSEGFDPKYVRGAHFGGSIRLGANGAAIHLPGGVVRRSGIYRAALYDCTIGDGVLIANVGRYIARYDLADRAVVENVGEIICTGKSAFGNGVEAAVVNESGGREVPVFDHLTAQLAYVMAMYRHRRATIARLEEMIRREVEARQSDRGTIGAGSRIVNTLSTVDVRIGEEAVVEGALSLRNGTINSTVEAPTYVGAGVTASDFIAACGSRIDTGSMIKKCFIGEGVLIENGFSAENSLFFANSHCNHGEACSVFAGPYTVSHHRATLLIAGYFLFFNAGSGANQSNHMYKSGPVHQGIHLRGCKFASDAYVLLPAATGAFSIVKGRHYDHHDTRAMPFSYLIEEAGESVLLPGIGLRSFGTARDVRKWPKRDRRNGQGHDIIHYDLMNPYTAGWVLQGVVECKKLLERYSTAEAVKWNHVKIKMSSLRKGLLLYTQALRAYLGERFASGIAPAESDATMREWVDWAGMIAPRSRVDALLDRIDSGEIPDLESFAHELHEIVENYRDDEMKWAHYALGVLLEKDEQQITDEDVAGVIEKGAKDRKTLDDAIEQDAGRDFAPSMSVGYGIDDPLSRADDFTAVRGTVPKI